MSWGQVRILLFKSLISTVSYCSWKNILYTHTCSSTKDEEKRKELVLTLWLPLGWKNAGVKSRGAAPVPRLLLATGWRKISKIFMWLNQRWQICINSLSTQHSSFSNLKKKYLHLYLLFHLLLFKQSLSCVFYLCYYDIRYRIVFSTDKYFNTIWLILVWFCHRFFYISET